MSSILLLHSALGLRRAVIRLAERLRAAGHDVATPDLYDGEVTADVAVGVAIRDAIGPELLHRRADAAAERFQRPFAVVGFSLGAGLAQTLAERRGDVTAAVLFHNARPVERPGRLRSLPLQLHVAAGDPWVDLDGARALADASSRGRLFVYHGGGHLFTDPDLPDHHAANSVLAEQRLLAALGRPDTPARGRI